MRIGMKNGMEEEALYRAGIDYLLDWYDLNQRILPWRQNPKPYYVWISEIMLQQTRVEAVRRYFERFIAKLPEVGALAAVSEDLLFKLWEGLGYYTRARNLKKAAEIMVRDYGGEVPGDYKILLSLPGIGSYTAGAVASIGFGLPEPAVDGNVLRVMKRMAGSFDDISKASVKKRLEEQIRDMIPKDRPGDYNQALMELGATVCIPNGKPLCEACPVMHLCRTFYSGAWQQIPVKAAGKKERQIRERTVFVLKREDRYGIRKREEKGLLAGLWELPGTENRLGIEEAGNYLKKLGYAVKDMTPLGEAKHIFSHMEWHMTGYLADLGEDEKTESAGNPEFVKDSEAYGEGIPGVRFFHRDEIIRKYSLPSAFDAYKKQFLKEKDDQDSEF